MPFIDLTVSRPLDPRLSQTLAEGVTERTVRLLRKPRDVTALALRSVPRAAWWIAGRSLEDLGQDSFWLSVSVTTGTNTKDEKAAYVAEIFAFMREQLGPLNDESYVLVHEVAADGYGCGGLTQERRYIQGRPDPHR